MKIKDVMTTRIVMIPQDASLKEAAEKMKEQDIGALPVLVEDEPVGMVTDRDIVVRAVAEGRNPEEIRVREILTQGVVSSYEDDDVKDAAELMRDRQIRRILVRNRAEEVVGILSLGDIAVETGNKKLGGEVLEDVSKPASAQMAGKRRGLRNRKSNISRNKKDQNGLGALEAAA